VQVIVIQKLANLAKNFLNMAKANKAVKKKSVSTPKPVAKKAKPAAKPAPKVISKAKKVVKVVAKKAAKPAVKVKAKAKPVAKKAVKVVAKKVVKPAPKVVAKSKPVAKKVVKAVAKKAVKPVVKKAAKPLAKKVVKPTKVVKKAAKPVAKTVKPVAKKKDVKKVVKPVAKTVKPVAKKKVAIVSKKKVTKPAPEKKVIVKAAKPIAKPLSKKKEAAKTSPKSKSEVELEDLPLEIKETLVALKKEKKVKVAKAPKVKFVKKDLPPKALITIPKLEVKKDEPKFNLTTQRYSDEDLKEFKGIIDKKLETAREELKNLKEGLENHTESQVGNKSWNMEEGSDTSEMEYLMNQIARQNKFIRDLEMALVRIENKTYGICRATGKLIEKNRLRIVPHATLSVEAKNQRKGGEDVHTPQSGSSAHMGSEGEGFGLED
jgi:RNA polymerase-binding transcription factor DksA